MFSQLTWKIMLKAGLSVVGLWIMLISIIIALGG